MNNNRYSANATQKVNRGIDLCSRPLGKGSRATTYNNIIRTNNEEVMAHVASMRFKFKRTSHTHGQDKWMMEDNAASHAHNLEHILYFSELLHRKQGTQPALPTLVEFLIFLIRHPNSIEHVGSFKPIKKTSSLPTTSSIPLTDSDFGTWETSTPSSSSSNPTWTDDLDTPNFDDEIDEM